MVKTILIHILGLCFFMLYCLPALAATKVENQSQCVQCHADLKKLIRLCWDVEKLKPRGLKSEESSGQG